MLGWRSKKTKSAESAATGAADRLIAEGNRAEERGELPQACELYRRALMLAPQYAKAHINLGIALEAMGDGAAAIRSYELALASDPTNPAANYNLGKLLHARGEPSRAGDLLARALQSRPDFPEARIVLASVLVSQGQLRHAITEFEAALRQRPGDFGALFHCAGALRAVNRLDDARTMLRRALAIDASNADAHAALSEILSAQGDAAGATVELEAVLVQRPDWADALHNYGCLLTRQLRLEQAESAFRRAVTAQPGHAGAHRMLGDVLLAQRRAEEALASYDQALAVEPDFADALSNRGVALEELRRYEEALASCGRALAIKPDFAEALLNRGNVLKELKRNDEALASYDKALAIKPDYAEALSNRGNALRELQRYDEALASYDQALAIKPDFAEAHFNQSVCRLLTGDFERGWEQYEWRWVSKDCLSPKRNFSQPLWLGKGDIKGKTILLHAEQGLGDTIQFVRYAQAVAQTGARVVLEVDSTLRSLMLPTGAHQVLSRGEPLPEFEFHCPLMSLPLAFNTRLQTIPATTPYLRATEAAVKKWQDRLGQRSALRVGIVWSGRRGHKNDRSPARARSIALSRLVALPSTGVTLVSLQNEVRAKDAEVLAANKQITYFGSELKDFSDTAALASLMDLVISIDTSVAHLAGALGKPVWILLPFAPDWRWLVRREDSPWYPTARLFRQPESGDWNSVMDSVLHNLADLCRSTSLDARS